MAVGYPAESWEAGGQTQKAPFDRLFSEMQYGKPFKTDPAVWDELRRSEDAPAGGARSPGATPSSST